MCEKLLTLPFWMILTIIGLIALHMRRKCANELDAKKWNNRIVVSLECCVGAG